MPRPYRKFHDQTQEPDSAPRYDAAELFIELINDMVDSRALSPCGRGLGPAAGERLMHQMSKPRRPHKDEDPAGTYWFDDQERLDRLYSYCKQDTETERELYYRLPALSPAEQALWLLSNTINARGFYIDRKFAEAARRIAQAAPPEIDGETRLNHRRRRHRDQSDRAAVVVRTILQILAQHIRDDHALCAQLADCLRNELHDLARGVLNEIRREDEWLRPGPASQRRSCNVE